MYNEQLAAEFINAIKELASKPDNCDNFQSYLSDHFSVWLRKYANTPENITAELKDFAGMDI